MVPNTDYPKIVVLCSTFRGRRTISTSTKWK